MGSNLVATSPKSPSSMFNFESKMRNSKVVAEKKRKMKKR